MNLSDTTATRIPAKAALLDCDGTLLDSMGFWREQENFVADLAGETLTPERLDSLRAMPTFDAAVEVLRSKFGDAAEEMAREAQAPILAYYQSEVVERVGALAFVASLHDAGVKCAVVSASPPDYLEAGLSRTGFLPLLDAVISVDEFGDSKRNDAIWLHALQVLGATPETTWGFEDSLYAIDVMHRLGIRTVGVYDSDDAGRLEDMAERADIAVRSFEELDSAYFL